MTPTQVDELRTLCQEGGHTVRAIADKLGLTHDEVRYQIRKLGLRTSVPWQRSLREMRDIFMDSEKLGIKGASEKYGISRDVVENIRKRYPERVKRELSWDVPDLIRVRQKALKHASFRATPEQALDFVSWLTVQALEGKSVGDVANRFIDYLRQEYGRTDEERSGRHAYVQVGDETDPEAGTVAVGEADPEPDRLGEFLARFELLQLERAVIYLQYRYGIEQAEIGEVLGVTPSRISQLHASGVERIRKQMGV